MNLTSYTDGPFIDINIICWDGCSQQQQQQHKQQFHFCDPQTIFLSAHLLNVTKLYDECNSHKSHSYMNQFAFFSGKQNIFFLYLLTSNDFSPFKGWWIFTPVWIHHNSTVILKIIVYCSDWVCGVWGGWRRWRRKDGRKVPHPIQFSVTAAAAAIYSSYRLISTHAQSF